MQLYMYNLLYNVCMYIYICMYMYICYETSIVLFCFAGDVCGQLHAIVGVDAAADAAHEVHHRGGGLKSPLLDQAWGGGQGDSGSLVPRVFWAP